MLRILLLGTLLALAPSAFAANGNTGSAASPTPTPCSGGWTGLQSARGEYRVWARCGASAAGDVHLVFQMIDSFWDPMIALMGKPVADAGGPAGGGDAAIDFYLVPPATALTHGTRVLAALGSNELGSYFAADPKGRTCSGFLVLRQDAIGDERFAGNVAHETFHLFQAAHKCGTVAQVPGGAIADFWFSEASAVWAETHFVRTTSRVTHDRWFTPFQKGRRTPLSWSEPPTGVHPGASYAAYIWPFFMEQERSAGIIVDVWKGMAAKSDWNGFMDAMDEAFSFRDNFPEFALRNLNLDVGHAIKPRYVAFDPHFPDSMPPIMSADETLKAQLSAKTGQKYTESLVSLKAHYYHWIAAPDLGKLEIDFAKLSPKDRYDAQVLVKSDGEWALHSLGGYGATATFCRPQEVYLVLSNVDRVPGHDVKGDLEVRPLKEECHGWSGWLTFTATDGSQSASSKAHQKAVFNIFVQDLAPNGVPAKGTMSVDYVSVNESWGVAGGCQYRDRRSERAGGAIPVEVTMSGNAQRGYQISVTDKAQLQVTEVHTNPCNKPATEHHTRMDSPWFVAMGGLPNPLNPDRKQPDRLRGTDRFDPGGDMHHRFRWNLHRRP